MKNKLFDQEGKEIPERPSMSNKDVSTLIITKAVDKLFTRNCCSFDEDEKDELIGSLESHYSLDCDEYELAKSFENDGWDVDRDFISKLEDVTGSIGSAFREHEHAWGKKYKPQPPFSVGTALIVPYFPGNERGVITGIYSYDPAWFTVRLDSADASDTSSRLIRFEDAKAAI
ncbi:hypothetical protein [Photobacterium carnosum]|uniref:hypothetical protein n=1 Tax=Photobacterium carnosum TaxID=2023717 RepID=UPI001E464DFE|nr:hypothetical protein [Photobacterium carnosum]MCD9514010.1 hypothetical protein [Photobacterium carnosum]